MTTAEVVARSNLVPVTKGHMSRIGWYAGYLVVEYPPSKKAPATKYIMGPSIAEAERDKLLRCLYPDNTLNQLKKKHNWQSHKVK